MAARRKEEAEQLREQRMAEIKYAALKLFATKGYHATGVMDIAREVGITHGTIYLYFKDKVDLLRAVVEDGFANSGRFVVKYTARTEWPAHERLRELLRALFNPTKDDAYFLRVAVQVYGLELGKEPPLQGLNHRFWDQLFGLLQPVVEEAQRDGDLQSCDALALTSLLYGLMCGYIVMYGDGKDFPLTPHADLLLSLISTR